MLKKFKKALFAVGAFLFAPVRGLLELVDLAAASARAGGEEDPEEPAEALWRRILLMPFRMVGAAVSSLGFLLRVPFQGLLNDRQRRLRFLMGLPALIAMVVFVSLISNQILARGMNDARYTAAFDQAEKEGNKARAKAIGAHMIREGSRANPEASFRFCKMLAGANELERANAIMEEIAPNDAPGYPPAHEQRAIAYANLIGRGAGPQALPILLWHLNQANTRNSEALSLAKGTYYRATGQLDMCIRAIESATRENPSHAFDLANLFVLRKDQANKDRVLKYARDEFRRRLAKDPLASITRIQLAQALFLLNQHEDAEKTIQSGIDLLPDDADLRRARTGLDLARYERTTTADVPAEQRLDALIKILETVEDPTVIFDRLVQLYNGSQTDEDRSRIRTALEEHASTHQGIAVLQFALSVIAIREQRIEDAIGLLERSLELDPKMHLAMNNLAWLVSERTPPELDRALTLAEAAVAGAPTVANYRDTLGKILFLRGDMQRALTELERALPGMPEEARPKIQARMAAAHRQLGNDSLADVYQARSEGKAK